MEHRLPDGRVLRLVQGDITKVPVDAMGNAANSALAGGGGVDGAIHRAGGPAIMQELRALGRHCSTGSAVVTSAGNLPAKYVLHAVGPVYRDGEHGEAELLASCYRTCLQLADARGCETVSFPSISTGVYGYPVTDAARVAISAVAEGLREAENIREATFVLFDASTLAAYERALNAQSQSF